MIGRINQRGVFAHQATTGPFELQQHVQEWLLDRLIGLELQGITTVLAPDDVEFNLRQERQALDTGGVELGASGERDIQTLEFLLADGGEFDLRVQLLVERGMHLELAETQGVAGEREKRQ